MAVGARPTVAITAALFRSNGRLALLLLPVSRLGYVVPLGTAGSMSPVGDVVELFAQPSFRLIF